MKRISAGGRRKNKKQFAWVLQRADLKTDMSGFDIGQFQGSPPLISLLQAHHRDLPYYSSVPNLQVCRSTVCEIDARRLFFHHSDLSIRKMERGEKSVKVPSTFNMLSTGFCARVLGRSIHLIQCRATPDSCPKLCCTGWAWNGRARSGI